MAYGRWRHTAVARRARVEIVPLIDVMFLLLCSFVYATMNMVVQQGIFVDLASSETSEGVQDDKRLVVVSVDRKGTYYIDKRRVSRRELLTALEEVRKRSAKPTVMVNADKDASHGQVVELLDLVRKSGVGQAVFAVQPEKTE